MFYTQTHTHTIGAPFPFLSVGSKCAFLTLPPIRRLNSQDFETSGDGGTTRPEKPGSPRKTLLPSGVGSSDLSCQRVNILGFVCHIQALPYILLWVFMVFKTL